MRHKISPTPCRHDIRPVLTQPSVGVPQYEEENVKDDGDVIADLIHLYGDPALVCWLGCLKCLPIRLYRIDLTVKFNFSNLYFYLMRSKLRCFSGVWFVHCFCLWKPADLVQCFLAHRSDSLVRMSVATQHDLDWSEQAKTASNA